MLDYLWGPSAEALIAAASAQKARLPNRFVQIGTASAPNITLPGIALRSSAIQLMGSEIGNVAPEEILGTIRKLMQAAAVADFEIATKPLSLDHIGEVWSEENNTPRVVFTMAS